MRKIRNKIDGLLLLDKPSGLSSNQAIQKVKYILNAEKVGHTGTLDPLATGLLPVCLGEATKFAGYLLDGNKEYIAIAQLGVITDSGDSEGNILQHKSVDTNEPQILAAFNKFTGSIQQTPPMYSALKHNGKPLYEYAREGINIEREQRNVIIHKLELISYDPALQQITFCALVSKGTYVRTLAEDIGNELGCGASLVALKRTKTNHFCINQAITIQSLQGLPFSQLPLYSSDQLILHLPDYSLTPVEFTIFKFGNITPSASNFPLNSEIRCYANGLFLGIAEIISYQNQLCLKPKRILSGLSQLAPWN